MVNGEGLMGVQLRDLVNESLESSLKSLTGSDLHDASVMNKINKSL